MSANKMSNTGHPNGLWVLFGTEMWERFNYYGMRAVLILFMVKALMFDKEIASRLYGSYTGLVYLTPLIGGYISDRFWGNQRSIVAGGLLMALGEFLLFFCGSFYASAPSLALFLFFAGLGFMTAGNGFFKPNISAMVGQLYPKGDRRIDSAYTIFYMGINVGGALGPFVLGILGDTGNPADFKWAFLAGGVAMLIGVWVQLTFHRRYVKAPDGNILGLTPANVPIAWTRLVNIIAGLLLFSVLCIGLLYLDTRIPFLPYLLAAATIFIFVTIMIDKSLTTLEKRRVMVLFVLVFFVIFFWSAFEQAGASLTFFADEQTRRDLGFFVVPTSWFQSLNSIFVIAFAPVFAWLWVKLGKKEPSSPTKFAMGLMFLALGYLWIAFGVKSAGPGIKVSMIWLIGMYALHTWGELCLSPIGLSLFNKLSPIKYASLLMGVWFLGNAFANTLAGTFSSLYPDGGKTTSFLGYQMHNTYDFFMLFVVMAGVASLILFSLSKWLQKMMTPSLS